LLKLWTVFIQNDTGVSSENVHGCLTTENDAGPGGEGVCFSVLPQEEGGANGSIITNSVSCSYYYPNKLILIAL